MVTAVTLNRANAALPNTCKSAAATTLLVTPRTACEIAMVMPAASSLPELLRVADRVIDGEAKVRDAGLLESALARPRSTAFGQDAYPDLDTKAAALLHSLARHHALIDGNKRLALGGLIAFYGLNGRRLTLTNDAAYDLVMTVAAGGLDAVGEIAEISARSTERWR
jgi:death-on-curing protein